MGDLTTNLSRSEFACKCRRCVGKVPAADFELVNALQKAADHFSDLYNRKVVLVITSANRCEYYNERVGGATKSKHKDLVAADFYIKDVPIEDIVSYVDELSGGKWGIGEYLTFVHLDVRAHKARWKGTY